MKITIEIDLRKSDPLGLDLVAAYDGMRTCYSEAAGYGEADSSKAGYWEHRRAHDAFLSQARRLHGLLLVVSKLVGPKATASIKQLQWARTHDYFGNLRSTPHSLEL